MAPAAGAGGFRNSIATILGAGLGSGTPPRTLCHVHIVGGAGSGKTVLGRYLAQRMNQPVYALDDINFQNGVDRMRPRAERLAAVERIASQPGWITEGIFVGWTDDLLRQADLIIWLDLPWYTAMLRILRRHIHTSLAGTNRYPSLHSLLRFIVWSCAYYRPMTPAQIDALPEENLHSRAATARHLRPYRDKLIRCTSPAEVRELSACIAG